MVQVSAAAEDEAAKLIEHFGGLAPALAAPPRARRKVLGSHSPSMDLIVSVGACLDRSLATAAAARPLLDNCAAVKALFRHRARSAMCESVSVLLLNAGSELIWEEKVSIGTIDQAPIFPREVIRLAIEHGATALILVHNHPSGDPEPSDADIDATRRVISAARLFDIRVHDHIIAAAGGTVSFRERGLL